MDEVCSKKWTNNSKFKIKNLKLQSDALLNQKLLTLNIRAMKKNIYKTTFLTICILTAAIAVQAQLPNFIKVDTGAVSQLWGCHASSSCFDIDNDADLDITSSNSCVGLNRTFSLFKNERNGYYVEMPEFTSANTTVSAFGDIENDGDIDLITGLNTNEMTIYTNDGNGAYEFHEIVYLWFGTFYPTFLDIDNDGFLDVLGINRQGSVAYNDGNGGFPVTSGLGFFTQQDNVGLHGVSWGDPDDDGDLDFYGGYSPTNEYGIAINSCYINNGNGVFVQFDPTSPIVEDTCTTTCANWLDYDNDGDMDLYVHNVHCEGSLSALYENLGNMQFTRHDFIDEIYRYSWANSSVWGDLDNDGDLDLFISIENNPFPFPWPWPGDTSATPYNVIYLNDGNGQFTNILNHPLTLEDSHTAQLFDQDNDGDLDVVLTREGWGVNGYDNLFVNEGNNNSWIVLICEGTVSNKSAIGTRVQAKAFVNGAHITQTREITPINGHLTWANLRVHFGLGDAEEIDTLLIRWPSGIVDTYFDVRSNRFYRAIENYDLTFLCPTGGISFTTQEQIDNFLADNPDCVEIEGNVEINGSNITNLDGLLQLEVFGGHLEIYGNDSLTDLSGLNSVWSIAGDFKVRNNPVLGDFSGMVSLNSIGGNFQVTNNAALDNMNSLSGLSALTSIAGNLWISGNPNLTSLMGLLGVTSIDGYIKIDSNNALPNLSGLDNIEAASISSLYIRENDLLSTCDVTSVCDYLRDSIGPVEIHVNATGCNNPDEVLFACLELVDDIFLEGNLVLYPNPSSGAMHLRYSISDIRNSKLELYSIDGVLINTLFDGRKQPGEHELEIDVSDLPAGLYFLRVQVGDYYMTEKLVVIH